MRALSLRHSPEEPAMPVFDRINSWITFEPAVALLMIITAIVLFGAAFARSRQQSSAFWPWLRSVIEALVVALLFLGLLWAFRSILNSNRTTFNATHGSRSDANLASAYSIWGRPHVQLDLSVAHYATGTVRQAVPSVDPNAEPAFQDTEVREFVPQNSILSFTGSIDMTLSEREKGYALYSGFTADADFEYQIINDSDLPTEADFRFPLSPGQTLLEDFAIRVDGEDISPRLFFLPDAVTWTDTFEPHEQKTITVAYLTRGMEYLYYQIPTPREIRDFSLTITVDRLPVSLVNYPEGCLTPTSIKATPDGKGSILNWTFDQSVTTAGMGVALQQPEQPGAKVLRGLENSPYALTLLVATLALTLLILGQPMRFLDMALLSAAYCVQFLLMAAVSDYALGFWGSLLLGAGLTSLLAFLLFRRHPSKPLRILVAALVLFFTLAYPLSGLLTDQAQRSAFDSAVIAALIIYLFALSLFARLTTPAASSQAENA
jgi:hypothetical protein